jgi:hypothetical protein
LEERLPDFGSQVGVGSIDNELASAGVGQAGFKLDEELFNRMPEMVKGWGYVRRGKRNVEPFSDWGAEAAEADARSRYVAKEVISATMRGIASPLKTAAGFSPDFMPALRTFMQSNPMQLAMNNAFASLSRQISAAIQKDIQLTSPLTSGLVPFDLVAPTRLIYPVYAPLRGMFPRTQGQGTARKVKVLTGIAGSQTGGTAGNPIAWDIPELPGGGSAIGTTWPFQLPAGDTPGSADVSIPYKFFGRSEQVSWLAQWAGQGFEDVAGLANLILIQKAMMAEEYMLLAGSGVVLNQPAAPPTATARTALATGETAWSLTANNTYVVVTANNYFGETAYAAGNVKTIANAASTVWDVTIAPVPGALSYNVYTTGTASSVNPGRTSFFLYASNFGGLKITLYGTAPTAGANPPSADTGTGASTRYEGLYSILSGWAGTGSRSDGGIYPTSNYAGGYFNQSVGTVLTTAAVFNALLGLWDNTAPNNSGNGGFRADPELLITEAFDQVNLTNDIISKASQSVAYQLFISQDEIGNIKAGAAVSQFQNPFTRKLIRIMTHPWWRQGSAALMTFKLPTAFNNVNNAWEVVNVQDYVSIAWPVIDVTFRYSLFLYGTFIGIAPQYSGLIQGLQKNGAAPWS